MSLPAGAACEDGLAGVSVAWRRAGGGILPSGVGVWEFFVGQAAAGAGNFVFGSGVWGGFAGGSAGAAGVALALCGNGMAAGQLARGRILRESAGAFPAFRRPHERAATATAAVAGMGVLGDHAASAAGIDRRSEACGGRADRERDWGEVARARFDGRN